MQHGALTRLRALRPLSCRRAQAYQSHEAPPKLARHYHPQQGR